VLKAGQAAPGGRRTPRSAAGAGADPLRADRPWADGAAAAGRRADQPPDRRTASVHVSNILRKLGRPPQPIGGGPSDLRGIPLDGPITSGMLGASSR